MFNLVSAIHTELAPDRELLLPKLQVAPGIPVLGTASRQSQALSSHLHMAFLLLGVPLGVSSPLINVTVIGFRVNPKSKMILSQDSELIIFRVTF